MSSWILRRSAAAWCCFVFLLALIAGLRGESLDLAPDADKTLGRSGKSSDAEATLVVYNEQDPASRELASFYASKRMIPREQVIGLRCPVTEEITRAEFDSTIAEPLRRAFTLNFWWKLREPENPLGPVEWCRIRYVALIRGMPLKISFVMTYPGDKPTGPAPVSQHNEASVDSELALLGVPHPISGAVVNPYFRSFATIGDLQRPELLLVCRLDAPNAATVKRMITDSIATEKRGLEGFAYVDARGLTADAGGLKEGDEWLMAAASTVRRKGIPVILDKGDGLFPDGYPMRHAALYLGWYSEHINGTFTQPGFRFEPGAVACHIHSFSAITLRDSKHQWAGPLLEAGAAATIGNVYEPYLSLTPRLDTLFDRLLGGFTFAESAYMSQRALSWMTTFIGDPLYRPFPLTGAETPALQDPWQAYSAGIKVWAKEGAAAGELALKESGSRLRSGIIFEGLGLLELANNQNSNAYDAFEEARRYYKAPDDNLRTSIHEIFLLRTMGREPDALALAKKQIADNPKAPAVSVFQLLFPELAPKPPVTAAKK